MPLFRRRQPSRGPDWAAPLTDAQVAEFLEEVTEALSLYGAEDPSFRDGYVLLPGNPERYVLTDLVHRWAAAAPPDRMGVLLGHFDEAFESLAASESESDDVLFRLRPRLWSSEVVDSVDFPVISRAIADDLHAVLCVDLPDAVANLTPEEAEATQSSMDTLWSIAFSQIDDGTPVEVHQRDPGLTVFSGDSFFVASRLLVLERFVTPMPAHGALVAVPNRHVLVVHPIASVEAVRALNAMIILADRLYREGPGAIVPHVYWWRSGEPPMRIPSSVDEKRVTPPDELVTVLNELAQR